MKIEFEKIPEEQIENFKGGEKYILARMHVDDKNRIMKATLVPGASIGTHTHTDSSEIIFIINGEGTAIIDGKEEKLHAGDCHYCPKGSTHTLMNCGEENLDFVAVVPQQ